MSHLIYIFEEGLKLVLDDGQPILYLCVENVIHVEVKLEGIIDPKYEPVREWISQQNKLGNMRTDLLAPKFIKAISKTKTLETNNNNNIISFNMKGKK